jgi:integration host factor subunit beta
MNKGQLIEALIFKFGITKRDAKLCVDSVFASMTETLVDGGRMEIRGFGTLKVREFQPYSGRNPKSGAVIQVARKRLPLFKMGSELRNRVNREPSG